MGEQAVWLAVEYTLVLNTLAAGSDQFGHSSVVGYS